MAYLETSLSPYSNPLEGTLNRLGYSLFYSQAIPSTMTIIEDHLLRGRRNLLVALADHQTKGIGREDRVWLDIPGCSVMFSTNRVIPANLVATFADLVALQTSQALQESTGIEEIRLKYPNDIVINNQKTAGILVKNIYQNLNYRGTNIGIGINVHYQQTDLEGYCTDEGDKATALDIHTQLPGCRQDLLIAILSGIRYIDSTARIMQTNNSKRRDLNELWKQQSSLFQHQIAISTPDRDVKTGRVVDTEIGRGIQVEIGGLFSRWFNQFDTRMKVRLLD